jgi:hypothetical protein
MASIGIIRNTESATVQGALDEICARLKQLETSKP